MPPSAGFLPLLPLNGKQAEAAATIPRKRAHIDDELVAERHTTEHNAPKRPKSTACLRPRKHAIVLDENDRPTTSGGSTTPLVFAWSGRKVSRHSKFREVSLHDRPNRPPPDNYLTIDRPQVSTEKTPHNRKSVSRFGRSLAQKLKPTNVWHAIWKDKPEPSETNIEDVLVRLQVSGLDETSFGIATSETKTLRETKSAHNLGRTAEPMQLPEGTRKENSRVMRLNKRVSDLEAKLRAAKRDLAVSLETVVDQPPPIPAKFRQTDISQDEPSRTRPLLPGKIKSFLSEKTTFQMDLPDRTLTRPIPRPADARPIPLTPNLPESSSGPFEAPADVTAEVRSQTSTTPSRNETLAHGAASGLGLSAPGTPNSRLNSLSAPPPLINSIRKLSFSLEEGEDKENQPLGEEKTPSLASIDEAGPKDTTERKDLEQEARSVERQLFSPVRNSPLRMTLGRTSEDFDWDNDVF